MPPINETVLKIDESHWLVGNTLLLTREKHELPDSPGIASWSDGGGGCFTLRDAPLPLPSTKPLDPHSDIVQLVHVGGTLAAAFQAGEAFIKVKHISLPSATREHTTLAYLHQRQPPPDFSFPTVHFHAEFEGKYYIVLSKVHGQTLAQRWSTMDEPTKQFFINRIATICESLAAWTGDKISGVDGQQISDLFLAKPHPDDCSNETLLKNSEELGMDCSSLVFYHCDLGPENIIISPEGSVGIIDWETAGFVPKTWVRTKFRICSGLDLPAEDQQGRIEWRRRVAQRLEALGFQDVAQRWMSWGS